MTVPLLYCFIETCEWTEIFHTGKRIENNSKGIKPFELNYWSVLAMHEIGKGHTAWSTFCGYMNIPESINKKSFPRNSGKTSLRLYRDS